MLLYSVRTSPGTRSLLLWESRPRVLPSPEIIRSMVLSLSWGVRSRDVDLPSFDHFRLIWLNSPRATSHRCCQPGTHGPVTCSCCIVDAKLLPATRLVKRRIDKFWTSSVRSRRMQPARPKLPPLTSRALSLSTYYTRYGLHITESVLRVDSKVIDFRCSRRWMYEQRPVRHDVCVWAAITVWHVTWLLCPVCT